MVYGPPALPEHSWLLVSHSAPQQQQDLAALNPHQKEEVSLSRKAQIKPSELHGQKPFSHSYLKPLKSSLYTIVLVLNTGTITMVTKILMPLFSWKLRNKLSALSREPESKRPNFWSRIANPSSDPATKPYGQPSNVSAEGFLVEGGKCSYIELATATEYFSLSAFQRETPARNKLGEG